MAVESKTHTVRSVSEFIDTVASLPPVEDGFYTYRGERVASWQIAPRIMRDDMKRLWKHERDAVSEMVAINPNEFQNDQSMLDRLVRMQHFHLPTRLLDVSTNPLVALFYACESVDDRIEEPSDGKVHYISVPNSRKKYFDSDTISCVANLANLSEDERNWLYECRDHGIEDFNDADQNAAADRLLQFIRAEKPWFRPQIVPKDLDTLWYVVPKLSNRRIIAQMGAFLIFGLSRKPKIPKKGKPITFRTIHVTKENKHAIRRQLATLGITRSALFPEIENAAGLIVDWYS